MSEKIVTKGAQKASAPAEPAKRNRRRMNKDIGQVGWLRVGAEWLPITKDMVDGLDAACAENGNPVPVRKGKDGVVDWLVLAAREELDLLATKAIDARKMRLYAELRELGEPV